MGWVTSPVVAKATGPECGLLSMTPNTNSAVLPARSRSAERIEAVTLDALCGEI
jgi:hypothetical protein